MRPARHLALLPAGLFVALLGLAGTSVLYVPPRADGAHRVAHGDAERGRALLAQYQCSTCHAVPGVAGEGVRIGPPLDGFGRRSYIAGRVPNDAAALQRWLQEPQSLVPGTAMPDLGVAPDDARDIAAYLLGLR